MADGMKDDFITIEWHVDDVLEQRPDLTMDQARKVLHALKRYHDADLGINWEVIYWTADEFYPKQVEL
jgi:hypothetical protein